MQYQILVVDADASTAAVCEQALQDAGFRVAVAGTFLDAARQLRTDSPDLLITGVRLEAYNGIHLVFRCRAERADFPVIVIGAPDDLTADIRRLEVPYLSTPLDTAVLRRTVVDLLRERAPREAAGIRRWPRKWAALPATVSRQAARIVELSYGGVRLELSAVTATVDEPLEISLPTIGMRMTVLPRWVTRLPDLSCWCGAEVAMPASPAARSWRTLVDSIS